MTRNLEKTFARANDDGRERAPYVDGLRDLTYGRTSYRAAVEKPPRRKSRHNFVSSRASERTSELYVSRRVILQRASVLTSARVRRTRVRR